MSGRRSPGGRLTSAGRGADCRTSRAIHHAASIRGLTGERFASILISIGHLHCGINFLAHVLLSTDHVAAWLGRLKELDAKDEAARKEAEARDVERRQLLSKIEALKVLGVDLGLEQPGVPVQSSAEFRLEPPADRHGRVTWVSEVLRVRDQFRKPMSFEDYRVEIDAGPLAGEYEKSDKGFYHAISRLQKRGDLVKHRGWLFHPSDFQDYRASVERGADELPSVENKRPSPMGDAVKEFLLQNQGGVKSGDIVQHLKEDERFRETLEKNATGAYNVIARLAKRGEIRKEGRTVYPA